MLSQWCLQQTIALMVHCDATQTTAATAGALLLLTSSGTPSSGAPSFTYLLCHWPSHRLCRLFPQLKTAVNWLRQCVGLSALSAIIIIRWSAAAVQVADSFIVMISLDSALPQHLNLPVVKVAAAEAEKANTKETGHAQWINCQLGSRLPP